MKKLILPCLLTLALLIPNIVSAQWVQDTGLTDAFVAEGINIRSNHGLAVDPDGNVWIEQYYGDHVFEDETKGRVIYVFNSDNEQTSFSPISEFVWADGSRTDPFDGSGLGMSADYEGNIIATVASKLYKLDYKTGKVLAYTNVAEDHDYGEGNTNLVKATADVDGNIYVRTVFPGNPILMYDTNLESMQTAVALADGFSRSMQVSKDGMTIWHAGYDKVLVMRHTKPDDFSSFGAADTVLRGIAAEAFTLQQSTGNLWVGAGSSNDLPDLEKGYLPERFYGFDVATLGTENEEPLDSLVWDNGTEETYTTCRPRSIGFTADGNTAYIGMFECNQAENTTRAVQKFTNPTGGVSNELENSNTPTRYALEQNYPNPFNPTTNISFTLQDAGMVTLKVYDMTGREVATVAKARFTAGTHQATFDASNLSSGVYLYSLQANGVRLTNKMTLIK